MKKALLAGLATGVLLLGLTSVAHALSITPTGYGATPTSWIFAGASQNEWQGSNYPGIDPPNSESKILDYINTNIVSMGSELYKGTPAATEEGALVSSYSVSWIGATNDESGGAITYTGGTYASSNVYLFVKDGRNTPYWYLFNLTQIGWDGKEELDLSGFWPSNGSISHIALYGGSSPVPEPATMLLFGAGLAGLAGFARRKVQ